MSEYGAAITWFVILSTIFVTGLLFMMEMPVVDVFMEIGVNSGADQVVTGIIYTAITVWLPLTIVFSLIVFGWRKSRNRIE